MQYNPGQRTIEAELMDAIAKAGGVIGANTGQFTKVLVSLLPGLAFWLFWSSFATRLKAFHVKPFITDISSRALNLYDTS